MKIKKLWGLIATVIICAITYLMDKFQWNIIAVMNAKYNSLVSGWFYYLVFFIRVVLIVAAIVLAIRHIVKSHRAEDRQKGLFSWLSLVIIICTVLFQSLLPLSEAGIYLNHLINKADRTEIIDAIYSGEMTSAKIDENEYYIPNRLFKGISYDATILTSENEGEIKAMFYVYKSFFKHTALVYTSDGQAVESGDFRLIFNSIRPIDENWYSVSVTADAWQ